MKRIILCLFLFLSIRTQAQQINPVPDYVFSNRMSVGRNAVTDTAAYFSIGPRYNAIRGMMPPMVTDTASVSGTKRNGLLIFSIQKNKYLYWDSVGVKWAEMAGTGGSAITGSGVAGYMPEFTTSTNLDTTRLYHSAGRFAIGSTTTSNGVFNVYSGQSYMDSTLKIGNGELIVGSTSSASRKLYVTSNSDVARFEQTASDKNMVIELRHTNPNASGTIREESINFLSPNTSTRGRITFYPSDTFNVRNYLAFFTPSGSGSNAERMRIANDGEVHIGIADAGAFALQVSGSIYATQDAYIYANIRAGRGAGNVASNTTFGASALNANTTGNNIVAVGSGALQSNTSGSLLTAVGEGSLNANTTGNGSTAVGRQVLYKNTTGEDNTAIGSYWNDLPPMLENTTGSFNTAVGGGSLSRATTASSNTAVGYRSLNNITTGGLNTALGEFAGAFLNAGGSNATSTNSIYIGRDTRASANGNTNEIVIGHNGRGNGSNTTTIGNTSTVGTYFPAGEMYINTTTDAGAYALQVAGAIYNTTTITTGAPTGGSIKPWRLGEAATVSPTSPNRTIRVEIDGTVYYIHAKTTND